MLDVEMCHVGAAFMHHMVDAALHWSQINSPSKDILETSGIREDLNDCMIFYLCDGVVALACQVCHIDGRGHKGAPAQALAHPTS